MRKIEISIQTILFAAAIVAGIWLFLQIKDILLLVFVSFLLMTAIFPMVAWLERFRIPRGVSTLIIYIVVFGTLGVIIGSAIPALVIQFSKLAQALPKTITQVLPYWNIDASTITSQLGPLSSNVLSVIIGVFNNILTTFTVLFITFYFILERRNAQTILTDFLGTASGIRVATVLRDIEQKLGAWVRGELLLMTFVGIMTYIGLTILKIEYAFPLAIIAGLLEIIPMIGPIMASIPSILVGLSVSPVLALSVAAMYIIVQQIESNIVVPLVIKKSVGLSPLITIIALMVGGRLGGVAGAILSVPLTLVAQVILVSILNTKNPAK